MQPLYSNSPYYGDGINEQLFQNGLCLPSGSNLKDKDIVRVCKTIKEVID
jgi:dTDP-4-amino-4,6-dideoxygalactose transaminase